jgi:hypothetical protein
MSTPFTEVAVSGSRAIGQRRVEFVPFADAPHAYDLLHRPDRPPTVLLTYDGADGKV